MRCRLSSLASRERLIYLLKVCIGITMLLVSEWVRWNWQLSVERGHWFYSIVWTIMYINCVCGGLGLCLVPFRSIYIIDRVSHILGWPLGLTLWILHFTIFFSSPFMITFFLVLIFVFFLIILQATHVISTSDLKPFLYPFLTILFLVFSLRGHRVVGTWLRFYAPQQDFSKLMPLVRPKMMRFYLYALAAAVYLVAKQEQFADMVFIPLSWWITYKDMFSEVLLTFVAIDAVLGAWRERMN